MRRQAAAGARAFGEPADNRWFSRIVVAAAVIDTLAELDLEYPEVVLSAGSVRKSEKWTTSARGH